MKKHNNHINNDFQSHGMKTIKILIFVVLTVIGIIYIPWQDIPFADIKITVKDFFDTLLTPENKHWIDENQNVILIFGGLVIFIIVNSLNSWYNSKEYKKIRKQRKEKVSKTTSNFVVAIVIILIMFFLIKSHILFKEDSNVEKTLLSMKKAPFVDYKSSSIEVEDTIITASFTDLEIKTENSREYTQVSKDQTYEKFKNDYNFKQYLTFYQSETYMYNMKYLNQWFTPAEVEKISKFWEP